MRIGSFFLNALVFLFFLPSCYADPGFYLGAAGGYGETALSRPPNATSFSSNGALWALLAGYQFNAPWSVEGGYIRMHNVHAQAVISGVDVADTVEPSLSYAAVKAHTPLGNNWGVYGKLGAAYSYGKSNLRVGDVLTTSSESAFVPYVALGLDYALTNEITAFFDVSTSFKSGGVPRLTPVLAGLRYQF